MCTKEADGVRSAQTEPQLRAAQAAERLGVHVSTVYRLVSEGRLRSARHGVGAIRPRGLRIPASSVAALLAGTTDSTGVAA
jgi:excisionase family DNA binding protein